MEETIKYYEIVCPACELLLQSSGKSIETAKKQCIKIFTEHIEIYHNYLLPLFYEGY